MALATLGSQPSNSRVAETSRESREEKHLQRQRGAGFGARELKTQAPFGFSFSSLLAPILSPKRRRCSRSPSPWRRSPRKTSPVKEAEDRDVIKGVEEKAAQTDLPLDHLNRSTSSLRRTPHRISPLKEVEDEDTLNGVGNELAQEHLPLEPIYQEEEQQVNGVDSVISDSTLAKRKRGRPAKPVVEGELPAKRPRGRPRKIVEDGEQPFKKSRGRPRKVVQPDPVEPIVKREEGVAENQQEPMQAPLEKPRARISRDAPEGLTKKPRGRPRKVIAPDDDALAPNEKPEPPAKKPRGRPRKVTSSDSAVMVGGQTATTGLKDSEAPPVTKKRGRPRKVANGKDASMNSQPSTQDKKPVSSTNITFDLLQTGVDFPPSLEAPMPYQSSFNNQALLTATSSEEVTEAQKRCGRPPKPKTAVGLDVSAVADRVTDLAPITDDAVAINPSLSQGRIVRQAAATSRARVKEMAVDEAAAALKDKIDTHQRLIAKNAASKSSKVTRPQSGMEQDANIVPKKRGRPAKQKVVVDVVVAGQ